MPTSSVWSSLAFGAMTIVATAMLFAALTFVSALGFARLPSVAEAPAVVNTMTALLPIGLPFMMLGFALIFSAPAAGIAAIAFYAGINLVAWARMPRAVFVLVGTASGAIGAKVAFFHGSYFLVCVGVFSGLVASLAWLLVPAFSSIGSHQALGRGEN